MNMHLVPADHSSLDSSALILRKCQRVEVRNLILDSESYTRSQLRMNNCILYQDPTHLLELSYGLIKYFVSIDTDTNNRVLAVRNILCETPETLSTDTLTGATAAHIKVVSLQSDEHCISIDCIITKFVFMNAMR